MNTSEKKFVKLKRKLKDILNKKCNYFPHSIRRIILEYYFVSRIKYIEELKNKISLILPMFIWNRNQTSSLGFVYIHNRKTGSWKIAWYRDIFYYDDLRRLLKERKELNDEILGVGTSFVSPCYLPY